MECRESLTYNVQEITCWRISVNNDTSEIVCTFWHQMIGFLASGANKSVEAKTIQSGRIASEREREKER